MAGKNNNTNNKANKKVKVLFVYFNIYYRTTFTHMCVCVCVGPAFTLTYIPYARYAGNHKHTHAHIHILIKQNKHAHNYTPKTFLQAAMFQQKIL